MRAELFSSGYRAIRRHLIDKTYKNQQSEGRPRDLEEVVEKGDDMLKKVRGIPGSRLLFDFSIPQGIGVNLYELYFPSPLTLASFKDDLEVIDLWLRLGLGGATLKTMMKEARAGNPRPRLQEVQRNGASGFLNAMGLPGKAMNERLDDLAASNLFSYGRPIGISIGGKSIAEYKENVESWYAHQELRSYRNQYLEINISCPNTPEGSQMTRYPHLLEELLADIRRRTNAVLGVKLSPDQKDIDLLKYAAMAKSFPRTYLNIGNTQYKTCEEVGLPKSSLSIGGGGFSGPAIYERALGMVRLLAPTNVPLIATGGIDTEEKVRTMLESGASLVGMATAVVQDMYCIPRINAALASTTEVRNLNQLWR